MIIFKRFESCEFVRACVSVCVCARARACVCACMHAFLNQCVCYYCIWRIHTHVRRHTPRRTRTRTHEYTHTHTHTQCHAPVCPARAHFNNNLSRVACVLHQHGLMDKVINNLSAPCYTFTSLVGLPGQHFVFLPRQSCSRRCCCNPCSLTVFCSDQCTRHP